LSGKAVDLARMKEARQVPLTLKEKQAVVQELASRYRRSAKGEKGRILDETCRLLGYNRLTPHASCTGRRGPLVGQADAAPAAAENAPTKTKPSPRSDACGP